MHYGLLPKDIYRLSDHFDALIIGSGIGGLICACCLAQTGQKVLLIEKHSKPGGCCSNFKRSGFTFDAGPHLFAGLSNLGTLDFLLRKLKINVPSVEIDPIETVYFGNTKYDFSSNIKKLKEYFQNIFPDEKNNLENLFADLKLFYKKVLRRNIVDKQYYQITFQDYFEKYIKDKTLLSLLTSQWPYLGSRPNKAIALPMLSMLTSYWFEGLFYPLGGSQALSDAIYNRFIELGGTAIFNREVLNIENYNDKLFQIYFNNSDKITGNSIIFNGSEFNLAKLLNKQSQEIEFIHENYKTGIGSFILYLGLKTPMQNVHGIYYDHEDINDPENDCMVIGNQTNHDPSLAPGGKGIISIFQAFPKKYHEVADWNEIKKISTEETLKKLEKKFPGMNENIETIDSATPKTIFRYTLNSEGSCYGHSYDLNKQNPGHYVFPDNYFGDNIYMTGHWTFPGGGVNSAAISGFRIANNILNKINS